MLEAAAGGAEGMAMSGSSQAIRLRGTTVAILLAALEKIDVGSCERTTGGGYNCYADGMRDDSEYSADRCCDSCIVDRALKAAGLRIDLTSK